jgi:PIN domain nuclease of toxin-antitoxin system
VLTEYVADTHAFFWYLTAMPQLGANALNAFRAGEQGQARIYLPSIVLAELYYLNEKLKRPLDFAQEFARIKSGAQFSFVSFTAEDVMRFEAPSAIPEMHDRMIAGVALQRNCPCLTRDSFIVNSGIVQTVW